MSRLVKTGMVFLGAIFFLGAMTGVPTAAEDMAKIVEGAKREGGLVTYASASAEEVRILKEEFEKEHPFVKVQTYRTGGQQLLSRILTEALAQKWNWDVVFQSGVRGSVIKEKGLLMKFDLPEMKHYQKGFIDPEGLWVSIYMLTHVIGYNSNLVTGSDIPKSYEDLLDPKWKKRMALDSEEYVWFANMLQSRGREKAISLMRGLAKQELSFRRGHNLLDNLLVAGEFYIVVNTYAHSIEELKRKGAPVDWVPVQPVVASHKFTGISNHARNPNAAKLFVNFLLSKKGQQIIANRLGRIPTRFDVKPNSPRLKEGITFFPEDLSVARDFEAMVKLYDDIFRK